MKTNKQKEQAEPSPLERLAKKVGRKTAKFKGDLAYSLLPKSLQYDRGGDMQGETVVAAQEWLQFRNMQMIFAPSVNPEDGPFKLVLDGELMGEGFMGWRGNVYVCQFSPAAKQKEETETPKTEGAYRRGYQLGYDAAMENIKGEFEIALTRMSRFRDYQLDAWRHEQTLDKVCEPPRYNYPYVASEEIPIDGCSLCGKSYYVDYMTGGVCPRCEDVMNH